ncbi:MAG: hypothetical protein LC804_27275, partial [Acidobacteria bacterium]|nr:hypothetical protein [Acidobacteriota bacterium]
GGSRDGTAQRFHGEEALAKAISFSEIVRESVAAWRASLLSERGRKTALWGSGSRSVGFLGTLGLTEKHILGIVDINPRRHGMYMPGFASPILSPAALSEHSADVVIVMNPMYVTEIGNQLKGLGLEPEILAVNQPPTLEAGRVPTGYAQ